MDNDDEEAHKESFGNAEYSPVVNSEETPIDEDGDTDFAVCPIPNLN